MVNLLFHTTFEVLSRLLCAKPVHTFMILEAAIVRIKLLVALSKVVQREASLQWRHWGHCLLL